MPNRQKLQQAVTERAAAASQIQRMYDWAEANIDDASRFDIERRLGVLETAFKTFQRAQSTVELYDVTALENNDRAEVEELYFSACAKFEFRLTVVIPRETNPPHNANVAELQLMLPKISPPQFDGDYTNWLTFYDKFKTLVHDKPFDPIYKFETLRNCLVGNAKNQLKDLELTNANYDEALQLLYARWNNPKLIAHSHMAKIFEFPALKTPSSENLTNLMNTVQSNLRSLKTLGLNAELWDDMIVYIILAKLDLDTKSKWDDASSVSELPKLTDLYTFLERRALALRSDPKVVLSSTLKEPAKQTFVKQTFNRRGNSHVATTPLVCACCNVKGHTIRNCRKFSRKAVNERRSLVKEKHLCFNCLEPDHMANSCTKPRCSKCKEMHHEILHITNDGPSTSGQSNVAQRKIMKSYCLLSTAIILVKDKFGNYIPARAFIDGGSQLNFMTEEFAQILGVKQKRTNCVVGTVGGGSERSNNTAVLSFKSCSGPYEKEIDAVIMKKITDEMPDHLINTSSMNIPSNLVLADPKFNEPCKIDILLGKSIEIDIKLPQRMQISPDGPFLENTTLGWIVGGDMKESNECPAIRKLTHSAICPNQSEDEPDSFDLRKFWELEEVSSPCNSQLLSEEEKVCEKLFVDTVMKREDGYYQVALPFRRNIEDIGESKPMAMRRLNYLLKRLEKRPEIYEQYADFLDTYEKLNHMVEVPENRLNEVRNYIPHQFVLRPSSSTTKLRVVFDASAKTASRMSYNDLLMVGPVVQSDLFSILCRYRTHTVVFSTDIEKMYRQVRVSDEDSFTQCILWKPPQSQQIKTYRLSTVTYGTSCAPYLATRTLSHLADEQITEFPAACTIIKNDTYVDDILSGASSLQEAVQRRNELMKIFNTCNMNLRKWNSNSSEFLKGIPESDREPLVHLGDHPFTKTLGMAFAPRNDAFIFVVKIDDTRKITKRTIMSDIARIYDPLGLISPIVSIGKITLQTLWLEKLQWDETPFNNMVTTWKEIRQDMSLINNLVIPRQVTLDGNILSIQIHGFADASQLAYGACLYLRSVNERGEVKTSLICAKSKVAPLKTVSIPRLELCAYVLLCRLSKRVSSLLNLPIEKTILWTDSKIVLAWVMSQPYKFKTFVANRISKIHELTDDETITYKHVPGKQNPADLVSRGVKPKDFVAEGLCQFWFNGPQFLVEPEEEWPNNLENLNMENVPDKKTMKVTLHSFVLEDLTDRVSESCRHSFTILNRIFGYVNRFIRNCRSKTRTIGPLTLVELEAGMKLMVISIQQVAFRREHQDLLDGNQISSRSKLKPLAPLMFSTEKLLRVGGRLRNCELSYDQRHPILLPGKHFVTNAIFRTYHFKHLHCGPKSLLCAVREQFWIVGGRDLARMVVRKCVICFMVNPVSLEPLMGQLPEDRTNQGHVFQSVCVDYVCGMTVHQRGRGSRTRKVYVAVFVCMKTRAIHLELVEDLSTAAFIASLRRMIGRRGICSTLCCDNATNFTGAKNELEALKKLFNSQDHQAEVFQFGNENGITIKFSPPRGPHFNGLAEAGVKSFKHHLYRVAGNAHLLYEELNTLIIQIEAVLNSRPLVEMSSDPNDFEPITPGHFIIGRRLTSFPEPDDNLKYSHLHHYHRLRQLIQHFWKRWSKEYLNTLQRRNKWNQLTRNLKVGELVILKQDNVPPLMWPLGRIVQLMPGQDGVVRVAKIRTASGEFERPTVKICPLPLTDNPSD